MSLPRVREIALGGQLEVLCLKEVHIPKPFLHILQVIFIPVFFTPKEEEVVGSARLVDEGIHPDLFFEYFINLVHGSFLLDLDAKIIVRKLKLNNAGHVFSL